jgi:hypothetical protein
MKFTFMCEDDPMPFSQSIVSKRTVEFDAVSLNDIVAEFELFLKGAGFSINGSLDVIPLIEHTPHEWTQILQEDAAAEGYSHYYFDTERNK